MKHLRLRHFLLLVLTLLSAQVAWSQVTTSAMNGIITDKAGAGLPGATVIAVHTPTNTQYVAPTNSEGRFNIQNMRVGGPYTVRITFIGYKDAAREGIFLTLGQNLRLDINLSEATTELSGVTISGRRDPVINSDRTGAATNIQREQIERLPTLSRSFNDFTRLTPQSNGGQSFGGRNGNFNNVTIDGAVFNNSFGLSSTIGGQANSQPISLDAIQEIQVNLAPYDVRQGAFTGAGINAITRSGTNKFSGSAYAFRRNNDLVGSKVRDLDQKFQDFSLWQIGGRLGGPIIKDKLFFFVSLEGERRDDPPAGTGGTVFVANRPGETPAPGAGSNTSAAGAAQLTQLSDFLRTNYNYETGPFEGYQLKTFSNKLSGKLDWNINQKNTFNLKYSYFRSYRDVPPSTSGAPANGRGPTNTNLPFLAAYYRINNNLDSYIGELNSSITSSLSNSLQVGYTRGRDFRESSGGIFPLVDIENGAGQAFTSFGYEPFSANNVLNTDTWQFSDNLTYGVGKHVITLGTYNEFYKFRNGFAPNYYGRYRYASLADFYRGAGADYNPNTGALTPNAFAPDGRAASTYQVQYSLRDGKPVTDFNFADIKAYQLGFYAQDEFNVLTNLKLTGGVRVDVPVVNTDIARNTTVAEQTFRGGEKIFTDQLQKSQLLWSPRVGFNWDVNNDQKTQLRGGTGVFTGRVPYVWISNQASNNGVLFGGYTVQPSSDVAATNPALGVPIPFTSNVDAYRNVPAGLPVGGSYDIAVTERDFKFPQVWRTNLALDQRLPGDVVLTLEGIYTKDINAVYHVNANLPESQLRLSGADNRLIYRSPTSLTTRLAQINSNVATGGAIVMKNTNKGYSYTLTTQLQKTFASGISASLAYNYADARSVNDGGSIANSIWRDRQISADPNEEILSYSNFLQQHRIIGSFSYRKEYLNHLGTTVSAFFDAGPGFRYSYTYNNDLNGDFNNTNDLLFVPRTQADIILRDRTYLAGTPQQVVYTAAQQWADLDAYISQDKYLSKRRGEYAERNGAVTPWAAFVDARLLQDIFTDLGENRNTLQFSVDVFNIGNLLNKNWGVSQAPNRQALLAATGQNFTFAADGRPEFNYNYLTDPQRVVNSDGTVTVTPGVPLTATDRYNTGEGSRWRIQLGLRYLFN
ncbi:Carboxypeptidase regulatory-like domain-containing protein [Hymenobacter daecheongensis DSM 21074]|uniref:Carboxypeptidase regulatory-like domain-containing protein n=1 Tax=Hymenobacter daecheongensis DSM 21074 TaxID=1121955 RepID=A0A1M6GHY1_9BACT|nr:TonB-dependent receptor [Hymenobacter daecheongensis]SHJ09554.1 Carboxypeptidase regulatory-like domain-containing protein [Hymenobacter daecheongensis DSM 21074]